ncbi:MAG: PKD domain-containing protein [bacterium]
MKSSKRLIFTFITSIFLLAILVPVSIIAHGAQVDTGGSIDLWWLEAESGSITLPVKVHDDENASGGQFIEVMQGYNSTEIAPSAGHITYEFIVRKPGTYKVWGRVIAPMHDEDAFWVKMDDDNWIKWKDIEVGCQWHWGVVHDNDNNNQEVLYNLTAGSHTLAITYCLDGTRLDKLLITNDLDYTPTSKGPGVTANFDFLSTTPILLESVYFDGSASMSTEGKIVSYEWDFGDGNTAVGATASHTYAVAGEYPVKLIVTDDSGLTGRLTKMVTVYTDEPVARFIYSPDLPKPDEVVTLDASSSLDANGTIVNYAWDFGDSSAGKGVVTKHTYTSDGKYRVTLTVTDDEGKTINETQKITVTTPKPKKVIYETDMCLDVDDVGASAILHALANRGEVEILAVCFNEVHPSGAAAIDAINTWYGRGDIPIGIYKGTLPDPDYSEYLDDLTKFPHDLNNANAPSALEVYRDVLLQQPDSSVTIISVGFLNNLNDLLRAEPNLVARTIKELVIMAGVNHDGFNLVRHNLVSASENIIKNWPTPIVFSQAGGSIFTGSVLKDAPEENPVKEAYYRFFNSQFCNRPSWDEMAVLYGVRGLSHYYNKIATGTGSLSNGYVWQMKPGFRAYLRKRLSNEDYEWIIEQFMMILPSKK